VVDYVIVSASLLEYVNQFNVLSRTESDHFPLICKFQCSGNITSRGRRQVDQQSTKLIRFAWNESNRSEFTNSITSVTSIDRLKKSVANLPDIDSVLEEFSNVFKSAGVNMQIANSSMRTQLQTTPKQPEWFDTVCNSNKKHMYDKLKHFRKDNTHESLTEFIRAKKVFKETCRSKKNEYQNIVQEKLRLAFQDKNSDLWSILKSCMNRKNTTTNNISLNEWFEYFSSLYNQCNNSRNNHNDQEFVQTVQDTLINMDRSNETINMTILILMT